MSALQSNRGINGDQMGFLRGLHPGIRAAVIFSLVLLGINLIHTFTGGATTICYPVQLLFYIANGALAGYLASGSGYDAADFPRVGAIAGLVAWIMPAIYLLIIVTILDLATPGVKFLGIVG